MLVSTKLTVVKPNKLTEATKNTKMVKKRTACPTACSSLLAQPASVRNFVMAGEAAQRATFSVLRIFIVNRRNISPSNQPKPKIRTDPIRLGIKPIKLANKLAVALTRAACQVDRKSNCMLRDYL